MERLLERDAELALLEEVVRDAASGRGGVVLVGGEAGIGKTALVRALRARLGERVAFLAGACEPLSVPVPLGPLRELAEAAEGGELPESGDRLVLARALLAALAARAPALAVVEDAHWADPATLDVLRLLARRVEERPIALVVTYREGEVAGNAGLGQLLGGLATSAAARRLLLRPLSDAAVRELAERAGVDAAQVARVTGGNPFLVVETIASRDRLPVSVRDATLARTARLSPAARRAVEAAAVIGGRVSPPLLAAVAPGSAAAVEEALARGVMVAEGSVLGFRHELIRAAVEASISPPRLAELHRRATAALARQAGAADNARLAHHAELAGLVDQARRYAVLAAADAERLGALREVSLQCERALRVSAGAGPEERFELLLRHATAANFANLRLEDAVESAQEAVALAVRMGDPAARGRALIVLAAALWSMDRLLDAKAAAEGAVAALAPAGDTAALARARAADLRLAATAFDPAAAVEEGRRALELAERCGQEEMRIDVAVSIGLARGHLGDAEALEALRAANRAARRAGLVIQAVRSYVNLVYIGVALRRHAFVDATVAEARAFFDEVQTTIPGYALELYRARSLLDRGRWDDAVAVAARRDRDWASETPLARAMEGIVRARRGDAAGRLLLEQAWEQLRGVPEGSRHGALRAMLVEAAWLRGERDEALRLVQEGRAAAPAWRFARPAGDLAVWAARLGLAVDPPAGADPAVLLELAGDWRGAVRAWSALEAPYEAALAALQCDERAARAAVAALERLGAAAAVRAFARERGAAGARVPRGPRRSTLANAAGLTRREQEVLDRLASGATNTAIAESLHLSRRTVAHHVSAILAKLGAGNRVAAIEQARARGLLAQDRHSGRPT